MFIIRRTDEFSDWLDGLKDRTTRRRLARRLYRAARGSLGDVKPVGAGVFEMREFFGPGWRMYYVQHHEELIVMLGGGGKSSQSADIVSAIARAAKLED